jgi:hypothetical protein
LPEKIQRYLPLTPVEPASGKLPHTINASGRNVRHLELTNTRQIPRQWKSVCGESADEILPGDGVGGNDRDAGRFQVTSLALGGNLRPAATTASAVVDF